jgi:hypothetical protein
MKFMHSSRLGLAAVFLVLEACATTVGVGGPQGDQDASPWGADSGSPGSDAAADSSVRDATTDGSTLDAGADTSSSDAGTDSSIWDAGTDSSTSDVGTGDSSSDATDDAPDDADAGEIPDGGFFDVIPPPTDCRSLLCPSTLVCRENINCAWLCTNPKFPFPGPRPGTCTDGGTTHSDAGSSDAGIGDSSSDADISDSSSDASGD